MTRGNPKTKQRPAECFFVRSPYTVAESNLHHLHLLIFLKFDSMGWTVGYVHRKVSESFPNNMCSDCFFFKTIYFLDLQEMQVNSGRSSFGHGLKSINAPRNQQK